jgi:pseudouridine-5'-phosphate glycosidase
MTEDFSSYIKVAPEVQVALAERRAVVALESTVIAHGLPYPENIEIAQSMEEAIRAEGAVPATIGLHDGQIVIGLTPEEIVHMGSAQNVRKVSRRDLAITLASGVWGATTVAGTMLCAHLAGIRFFATGGIGGVHRGAATTLDISADLQELSRTPVLVTCAGAKSILDLDLTLEYLETHGVPVIGWQTQQLPAFYVRDSGRRLADSVDDAQQVAHIARAQWSCGLGGIVVTCPIPERYALEAGPLEKAIQAGLQQAQEQGIQGAALTPFVLSYVAQATTGESVEANKVLLRNNAQLAACFARAYYS